MKKIYVVFCLLIGGIVSAPAAHAANPGDACTTNGDLQRNGGQTLICDGFASIWRSALEHGMDGKSMLQVGNDGGACTSEKTGRIRYDGASAWSYCSAETLAWVPLGGGVSSLSGLTAATATNTINNAAYSQNWNWSSLTAGTGLSMTANAATTGTTLSVNSNSSNLGKALNVTQSGSSGYAVYAVASDTSGSATRGVYALSAGSGGRGVEAAASNATGQNYGGYFGASGDEGRGVYAIAGSATGTTYGVYGMTMSPNGYGGYFLNAVGGWGVYSAGDIGLDATKYINWGSTRGDTGYGLRSNGGTIECKNAVGSLGWVPCATPELSNLTAATAAKTLDHGANTQTWNWNAITGITANGLNIGSSSVTLGSVLNVNVTNTSSGGSGISVTTMSTAANGRAINAVASGVSGATRAINATNGSTAGTAVYAQASNTTGTNYGVYARSSGSTGYGLYCESVNNANGCGGNRAWYNASDARLKTDIVPLNETEGLAAILQLRPVHYKWRDMKSSRKTEMGFIAQEVEAVLPALVGNGPNADITREDGTVETVADAKSMSYATVVVPLVKAVQELKAENDALRARIEALERQ